MRARNLLSASWRRLSESALRERSGVRLRDPLLDADERVAQKALLLNPTGWLALWLSMLAQLRLHSRAALSTSRPLLLWLLRKPLLGLLGRGGGAR